MSYELTARSEVSQVDAGRLYAEAHLNIHHSAHKFRPHTKPSTKLGIEAKPGFRK